MKLGLTVLRVAIGVLNVGHGAQKLFGALGGGGPEGTGMFFESAGLRPGKPMAQAAGGAELVGGALLALGWGTPLAATLISGVQITAIRAVHLDKGPWISDGGYEYNVTLLAALFALSDVGPGDLSIDAALGTERNGPGYAIAQLAVAAAGAAAVQRIAQGQPGGGPVEAATGAA